MKKYELTKNTKICFGHRLFQIRAITCFGNVLVGQFGGYIEKEENLSHDGNAWVYDNASVYGNTCIYNNTLIYNNIEE